MRLAFEKYASTGEPLIILHGLFGSRENWRSMGLRLAHHFRVFALDQRNHGDSPHSPHMDYVTMAEDVREFLSGQGLQRTHVLGHSMGAKTAMQFAMTYPERVLALISVDMAPCAYPARHARILEGLLSLKPETFRTRAEMEKALEPWVPDLSDRRFLLKNARSGSSGFHWRIGLREIADSYSSLSEMVAGPPFAGPALFLRGMESDYLHEEDLPGIKALFPSAALKSIPGAGHLVHVENPDVFLREVVDFLAHAR